MATKNPMIAGKIVIPEVLGNGIGNGAEDVQNGKGLIYENFGGGAAWGLQVDAVITSEFQTRGGVKYTGDITTYTGPSAISGSAYVVALTTTGADAFTLADGSQGESLYIYLDTDGGDATITPDNLLGYSTITLDDVGDAVQLFWNGTAWVVISAQGAGLA